MRTALALSPGNINVEHLPESVRDPAPAVPSAAPPASQRPARRLTAEQQARRVELVALLVEHKGSISAVARQMGKDRVQIRRWIKQFAITPEEIGGQSPD
jgi:transcriptional regulator of acetoin/glycerol metabolism